MPYLKSEWVMGLPRLRVQGGRTPAGRTLERSIGIYAGPWLDAALYRIEPWKLWWRFGRMRVRLFDAGMKKHERQAV